MQEELLQAIWRHNLYRPGALFTTDGAAVQVLHPGILNRDAGPDFSEAKIRIGDLTLVGNVELHIRSSDWLRHRHDEDPAYHRVILHVVFRHDTELLPGCIPLLVLGPHIPPEFGDRYSSLIRTTAVLPCAGNLPGVSSLIRRAWLSRLLVERWEGKIGQWNAELRQVGGDWNALLYRKLALSFGFKVNAAPFGLLAQSVSLNIIVRQASLFRTEALIFGQSGLLAGSHSDEYPRQLKEEYRFLRQKYGLQPVDPALWKFLRLRPANFPTVRLAQFAALLHGAPQLFTMASESAGIAALSAALSVTASAYWDTHYRWDESHPRPQPKTLGADAIAGIIINTLAPLRFLYETTHGRHEAAGAVPEWLEGLPAEDNNIVRMWKQYGWSPEHAGDSQSLIELYNNYCSRKRCLECSIGWSILRSGPDK